MPPRKMTPEEAAEIRLLHAAGTPLREIARRMGRHASHVRLVVRGELHRDGPLPVSEARALAVDVVEALIEAVRAEERARVRREDDDGE
jgi:IS30 family transposase